jgi:hypothetical protein
VNTRVALLMASLLPMPAGSASSPFNADSSKSSSAIASFAEWVRESGDNQNLPFLIVDKVAAKVAVFDARGNPRAIAPALLGQARGDHSVPGIGERPIPSIKPHERTTPAGRFLAQIGTNLDGEDILWVDYDAAVSLHRVRSNNAAERRLQRLASPSAADNRISYGCINVPIPFYDDVVRPTIGAGKAIVYVMPETKPAKLVFTFAK